MTIEFTSLAEPKSERETGRPSSSEERGVLAFESLIAKLGERDARLAHLSTLVPSRKVSK